jgi:hypothetical protein
MSNIPLTSEINELIQIKKDYEAKAKELGSKAIAKLFQPFFDNNLKIDSIQWTQYTPHFNDGDACEFGINEAYIGLKTSDVMSLQLERKDSTHNLDQVIYLDAYDFSIYKDGKSTFPTPECKELKQQCNDISSTLYELTDLCKSAFGDHAQITISRTSIEVDEYDHD